MSIAKSEFWSRLVESGLADPSRCQRWNADFEREYDDSAGRETKSLAGYLVRRGDLTKFQAARLLGDDAPALRVGAFVMTGDQPITPLSHWIPVQTAVGDESNAVRHGFLLRVPLAGLDETLRGWLAAHSEIDSETLQSVELSGGAQSEGEDQTVEIFSPLPDGGSLLKVLQTKQSLSSRKTVRIGVDLANALAALHAPSESGVSIAHGAIGADHVWVTPKGHAVLLRDPSSPARSPRGDLSSSWIDRIESPALYAAPELADPSVLPTPASDIYSLGCLLFSVFVGRPAFEGEDDRELFAAHNEDLPRELLDAVDQGASGNPILRVLAYAMAKDPAARFDSAASFADALKRAGEVAEGSHAAKTVSEKTSPSKTETPSNNHVQSTAESPQEKVPQETRPDKSPPANRKQQKTQTKKTRKVESTPPEVAQPKAKKPEATQQAPDQPEPPAPEPPAVADIPPVVEPASTAATEAPRREPEVTTVAPLVVTAPTVDSHEPDGQLADEASAGEPLAGESSSDESSRPRRRKRRRKNRVPILAGTMALPVVMLGLAIVLRGRGPEKPPPPPRPTRDVVRNVPEVRDSRREVPSNQPQLVNGFEIVDNDRLLWVPPYAADSKPPSLELLPPGPAAIVSVPLAAWVDNADASGLNETFGGEFDALIESVEKRVGVDRRQIARCTAALFPGRDGWPEVALAITLSEPVEIAALTDKWQAFESRAGENVLYAGEDVDGDAFYVGGGEKGKPPEGGKVTQFAVGSLKRIREVAESEGGSIPLVRSMQTLWDQTSEDNDLVALITPNFLFADGRQMVSSTVPEFRSPLQQWLIPNVSAVSLSADVNEGALYVELRELPSGGATSATLLKSFRESIDAWPAWADNFILTSVQDPSWRLLATRLPMMLRFVGDQTRSTILGETVVASTYLPVDAGTQVALATFLAMNTSSGEIEVAQAEPVKELTVDDMLDRPMSISFLQLSLQFAVDAVVDEYKQSLPEGTEMPTVRIIGGDLEKNGITQNQQIRGFERDNVPLRTVLTELVLGANPDKTATGPDDPKQALIWVVHPTGKSPAETEILITTRDAAEGQYELPKEFRLAEE